MIVFPTALRPSRLSVETLRQTEMCIWSVPQRPRSEDVGLYTWSVSDRGQTNDVMPGFVRLENDVYALRRYWRHNTYDVWISHLWDYVLWKIDAKCMRSSNSRLDKRRAYLNSQSSLVVTSWLYEQLNWHIGAESWQARAQCNPVIKTKFPVPNPAIAHGNV